MQLVAVNWHVYELLRGQTMTIAPFGREIALGTDALALGGLGLARIAPIIFFALLGGLAADTWDRRRVMIGATLAALASSIALAAVTFSGQVSVAWLYGLTAAGAAAFAFDEPARQAIVPNLVPRRDVVNAVSLNTVLWFTASVVGPAVAGVLIAVVGLAWVYALDALSFLLVLAALLAMRHRGRPGDVADGGEEVAGDPAPDQDLAVLRDATAAARARRSDRAGVSRGVEPSTTTTSGWSRLLEGIRFTFRHRLIWSTMLLDFGATFFGSARTMLPLIAGEVLGLGASGYGLLATAQPLGAIAAGVTLAARPPLRRQGRWLLAGVAVYGAATAAFGLSSVLALSYVLFAATGAGDTISTVIRGTIRQLTTPDDLRGRMTGVNMVFFMGGPQLGELEAGLVAAALGAPFAIVTGGVAVVVLTGWVAWRYPSLREYEGETG
jgi:MFS family permease